MSAGDHAFIELAVHDGIRERYARGDALVLCTPDLDGVIWASGAAATLFGFDTVYEFMDDWAGRTTPAQRQLRAAAARIDAGTGETRVMLRVSSGLKSRLEPITLKTVSLGDGTKALLIADADDDAPQSQESRAERIASGLGDAGTHVAVLDEAGGLLAASPGMAGLAIGTDTLKALVTDVAAAPDRLVKRRIATAAGQMPAAIARLADDPPLHLLFAVETGEAETLPSTHDAEPDGDSAVDRAVAPDPQAPRDRTATEAAPAPGSKAPAINAWSLDRRPVPEQPIAEEGPEAADAPEEPTAEAVAPGDESDPEKARERFTFERDGRPVRFVWKIDSEGRFSEISADFAAAVGPNAADVVGRRFADVAQVFGIDRDGAISDLLRRRDTWSGRSVVWPVQGTNLAVPVDLAALPTYTRERIFDGFRGFGIVRLAEATEDPDAIGLSLTAKPVLAETEVDVDEPAAAQQAGESDALAARTKADIAGPDGTGTPEPPAFGDPMADATPPADDPFQGETPALKFKEASEQPSEEKVIDLDERRGRDRDPLSSGEQAAFREIGRRLAETFGRRTRNPDTTAPEGDARKKTTGKSADKAAPAAPQTGGDPSSEAAEANDNGRSAETKSDKTNETPPASRSTRTSAVHHAPENPAPGAEDGTQPATGNTEAQADDGTPDNAPAAETPSRPSYDESLIDDLPIALIIHQGDAVHHANSEFFALTGHAGLEALQAAGGMGSLFADVDLADGDGALPPGMLSLAHADGHEIPVNARLQSILWHNHHALMTSLVRPAQPVPAGDPAAAGQTEALKVEVEELRSILETATDGVIILGEHGDIRSMNRSASALFDYEESETRGAPFAKLFAHESQRAVMDYLNGLSEHGVASVLNDGREVIGREASGGFIPLFMTIGWLSGSKGFCAVMRDITQWKRTEEDLRAAKYAAEQASGHKSEFLARVSHEIRTPLNAIIGFSDMMAEERFGQIGNPRYLEYARDIGRSGKHVLDIVNDLLDISKIEAGEMDIEFAAVALNEAIAETVSLLQPQANSQRVIIRTSLSSAVPEVVADERSIKQVAINLLSNAIRFTPAGGQIVVSTAYETNGSVVLRIRDTGIGMSRGDLDQAMKPFRQVDGTSRPREGTGLGLPLTKAMVEANRAQFDLRSTPNEGTLAEITFPSQRVLAD